MTTTVLRANATDDLNGSVTGAANAHTALSDDSDASYVTGGSVVVEVGTFTLGSGVTKSLTLRARIDATVAQSFGSVVRIPSAASGPFYARIPNTIGNVGTVVLSSPAEPLSVSQSVIDALQVVAAGTVNTSGAYSVGMTVDCLELYVDLVHVDQPIAAVTAVSPDPYTASTTVPVSWVNTLDADGGSQTRYWVKVFTAAQYGAGGFDPETSTPFSDTGVVLGSSTATNVGPLVTGDTYRVYVKVAQTVNGAAHWSAWDFDQFDLDVSTADIDSIVVSPQDSLARIHIELTRDAASEDWEFVEIQRSTDAGATWTPVRFANYVAPGDPDQFAVHDYETANDENVIYRARATWIDTGGPITGAWLATATATRWSSQSCWLKAPLDPSKNMTVRFKTMIQADRPRPRGVFQIIGAALPVVVSDVLSAATGSLDIMVDLDDPSPQSLLEQSSLLLHPPPEWRYEPMYFAPGDVRQMRGARIHEPQARWQVDYIEVAMPSDPTAGQ